MILPGMRMTGAMVGGSGNTVVQQYLVTRGKTAFENTSLVDGMDTQMIRGQGNLPYDNFAMAQEVSVETNPTTADVASGGVRINMIPRDGGNAFAGDVYFSGMHRLVEQQHHRRAHTKRAAHTHRNAVDV